MRYALLAFHRDSPVLARKNRMEWVASSLGHTYYRRGGSTAKRLSPAHLVYFRTKEEAQRAGYRRSRSHS